MILLIPFDDYVFIQSWNLNVVTNESWCTIILTLHPITHHVSALLKIMFPHMAGLAGNKYSCNCLCCDHLSLKMLVLCTLLWELYLIFLICITLLLSLSACLETCWVGNLTLIGSPSFIDDFYSVRRFYQTMSTKHILMFWGCF